MKLRLHLLVLPLLIALVGSASAQLEIRRTGSFDVHLDPFGGPNGTAAAAEVWNHLMQSGAIVRASGPRNAYVVRANTQGAAISGLALDPSGRQLFARSYTSRNLSENSRDFARDLLTAITGATAAPEGTIVFTGGTGRARELFAVSPDGSDLRQLTRDNNLNVSPALSQDGSKVAFTSYVSGYPDIHLLDLRSGRRSTIINSPGLNTGAAFAPNGRQIALIMSFPGNPELFTSNLSGRARRLTRTPGVESSPTWSPDGRSIAYVASDGGNPRIFIIPANGGQPRPLNTGHGYSTEPAWSPASDVLALTVSSGGMQIATHNLRTGQTQLHGPGEDPAWSPDGAHIAFVQNGNLGLLNVQTGARSLIVRGRGAKEPTWSR